MVRPNSRSDIAKVNPAATGGKISGLPREVSVSPGMFPGSASATAGDGSGEVSRGHSRRREALKGRILKCKEQSERTRVMWSGSKGMSYQMDLFDEALMKAIRPGGDGDGGTGSVKPLRNHKHHRRLCGNEP
jgi:hypothetical protein